MLVRWIIILHFRVAAIHVVWDDNTMVFDYIDLGENKRVIVLFNCSALYVYIVLLHHCPTNTGVGHIKSIICSLMKV